MLVNPYAMSDCDLSGISMTICCRAAGRVTGGTARSGPATLAQPSNAAATRPTASAARTSPTMTMNMAAGAKRAAWYAARCSRRNRSTLSTEPFAGRP